GAIQVQVNIPLVYFLTVNENEWELKRNLTNQIIHKYQNISVTLVFDGNGTSHIHSDNRLEILPVPSTPALPRVISLQESEGTQSSSTATTTAVCPSNNHDLSQQLEEEQPILPPIQDSFESVWEGLFDLTNAFIQW